MGLLDKFKKVKKEEVKEAAADKTAKIGGGLKSKKLEVKSKNDKGGSMKELYEGKSSSASSVDKTVDDKKVADNKKVGKRKYGNAYKVLIRPLITEKASIQGSENKYFFAVAKEANKIEIAKAIQDVYGVKPVKVNIIRMEGKSVRYGRKIGKRKNWKKAIIKLKKGEDIKVYEGV